MTFAQRRNRPTTHLSERIPVVKRRIAALRPDLTALTFLINLQLCLSPR